MVQFFVCRLLQPLSIFDNIQSFLQVTNPIWNLVCELNSKTQSISRGATYELGVSAKLLKRFSQQKVRKRKLSPRKGFCLDSWNLFRGDAASFQTCTSERLEDIFIFLPLIRNLLHWKTFQMWAYSRGQQICVSKRNVCKQIVTLRFCQDFWNLFLSTLKLIPQRSCVPPDLHIWASARREICKRRRR